MNLANNRMGYIATSFVYAVIYAFLVAKLPPEVCLTDGVVYGILLVLTASALRKIFRYALPDKSRPLFHDVFVTLLAVLATLCITGTELLVLYLGFPELSGEMVASLPLRLFITLLWFIILRLHYLVSDGKDEVLIESVSPATMQTMSVERISVRNGQKIKIIPVEDILYLQADGDYVSIHTAAGHWLKEQTMKYSEEILPADRFVRIHRSYIVNITQISRIERYGEQQSIILHNGERIKISASRYRLLRRQLDI